MSFERLSEDKRELQQEIAECEQKINELSNQIDRLEAAVRELENVRIEFWGVRHKMKESIKSASDWKGEKHDHVLESATDGKLDFAYEVYSDHIGDKIDNINNAVRKLRSSLSDYESDLIGLQGRAFWYDSIGA